MPRIAFSTLSKGIGRQRDDRPAGVAALHAVLGEPEVAIVEAGVAARGRQVGGGLRDDMQEEPRRRIRIRARSFEQIRWRSRRWTSKMGGTRLCGPAAPRAAA